MLTGPRAVRYAEIATLAAERTGSALQGGRRNAGPGPRRVGPTGQSDWEADHFAEMYALFRAGDSEFVTDTVEQVTGAQPVPSRRSSTRSSNPRGPAA